MRRLSSGLLFLLAPLALHAQNVLTEFGGCGLMDASNNFVFVSNASIPAGAYVIASTAVDYSSTGNTFGDSVTGPNWNAIIVAGFVPSVTFQWARQVASIVPAGTTFTWHMDAGATGHKACMDIVAFDGLANTTYSPASGYNSGTSTAPSAAAGAASTSVQNVVVMTGAFQGDPGTVTGSGVSMLAKRCQVAAVTFCLQAGYKLVNTVAAQTITYATTNSTLWTAALAEYPTVFIFANGFE